MTADDGYRVPAGEARAELKEKGSRFLAVVRPAADEAEARAVLAELAAGHRDATHHCWAWRLGWPPRERGADAGEPHGTAGEPMLQVLRGAELSDVMAVVVRWYGGVKLGKGGLARAYAGALRAALAGLSSAVRRPTSRLELEVPFDRLGAVRRLVRPPRVTLEEESYGESARLVLRVDRSAEAGLREGLAGLGIEVKEPSERRPAPPGPAARGA